MKVSSPEALQLFHEGTLALADVEANGMRVDMDYLDKAIIRAGKKIAHLEAGLREDPLYKKWQRKFGSKTSLGNTEQLAELLFVDMGYECKERTPSGRPSGKDTNLLEVDLPFVNNYRMLAKYKKAKGTFLEGIKHFTTEDKRGFWVLHPNFNLNIAASFRSSSNDPNFQNFPSRNEEMANLVRSSFIPRENHVLIESDFGGVEVGVAYCYNHDKKLAYDYIEGDMHRDMAMKLFFLEKDQVSKHARYTSKNQFVFPNFYGSYWYDCARHMWDSIGKMNLQTVSGTPMMDHLREQGVKCLGEVGKNEDPKRGTFQYHVKKVEDYLWNERYTTYTAWKKSTWESYQHRGYTKLLSGFVCTRDSDGLLMNRKQVINYQIQGAAFHCLLWCLIEMNKWLRKNKMRSMIVSQIHDSIIGDVHKDEVPEYVAKMKELMTKSLMQSWKWVIIPLKVEMEACPLGGNWFQKKVIKI